MSVTVRPGDLIRLDPSAIKVIEFDFDDALADGVLLANSGPDYGITITTLRQNGATALTFDNAGLANGDRAISARFLATTASAGDRYRVNVKGISNENPAQDDEWSINILIENR